MAFAPQVRRPAPPRPVQAPSPGKVTGPSVGPLPTFSATTVAEAANGNPALQSLSPSKRRLMDESTAAIAASKSMRGLVVDAVRTMPSGVSETSSARRTAPDSGSEGSGLSPPIAMPPSGGQTFATVPPVAPVPAPVAVEPARVPGWRAEVTAAASSYPSRSQGDVSTQSVPKSAPLSAVKSGVFQPSWTPAYVGALVEAAKTQWLSLGEANAFLTDAAEAAVKFIYDAIGPVGPPVRPLAGSLFIVDERRLPNWREDGYTYVGFDNTQPGVPPPSQSMFFTQPLETALGRRLPPTKQLLVLEWGVVLGFRGSSLPRPDIPKDLQRRALRLPRAWLAADSLEEESNVGYIWLVQYLVDAGPPAYTENGDPTEWTAPISAKSRREADSRLKMVYGSLDQSETSEHSPGKENRHGARRGELPRQDSTPERRSRAASRHATPPSASGAYFYDESGVLVHDDAQSPTAGVIAADEQTFASKQHGGRPDAPFQKETTAFSQPISEHAVLEQMDVPQPAATQEAVASALHPQVLTEDQRLYAHLRKSHLQHINAPDTAPAAPLPQKDAVDAGSSASVSVVVPSHSRRTSPVQSPKVSEEFRTLRRDLQSSSTRVSETQVEAKAVYQKQTLQSLDILTPETATVPTAEEHAVSVDIPRNVLPVDESHEPPPEGRGTQRVPQRVLEKTDISTDHIEGMPRGPTQHSRVQQVPRTALVPAPSLETDARATRTVVHENHTAASIPHGRPERLPSVQAQPIRPSKDVVGATRPSRRPVSPTGAASSSESRRERRLGRRRGVRRASVSSSTDSWSSESVSSSGSSYRSSSTKKSEHKRRERERDKKKKKKAKKKKQTAVMVKLLTSLLAQSNNNGANPTSRDPASVASSGLPPELWDTMMKLQQAQQAQSASITAAAVQAIQTLTAAAKTNTNPSKPAAYVPAYPASRNPFPFEPTLQAEANMLLHKQDVLKRHLLEQSSRYTTLLRSRVPYDSLGMNASSYARVEPSQLAEDTVQASHAYADFAGVREPSNSPHIKMGPYGPVPASPEKHHDEPLLAVASPPPIPMNDQILSPEPADAADAAAAFRARMAELAYRPQSAVVSPASRHRSPIREGSPDSVPRRFTSPPSAPKEEEQSKIAPSVPSPPQHPPSQFIIYGSNGCTLDPDGKFGIFCDPRLRSLLGALFQGWRVRCFFRSRRVTTSASAIVDTIRLITDVQSNGDDGDAFLASLKAQLRTQVSDMISLFGDSATLMNNLSIVLRPALRRDTKVAAMPPGSGKSWRSVSKQPAPVGTGAQAAARKARLKGGALGRDVIKKYSKINNKTEDNGGVETAEESGKAEIGPPAKPWLKKRPSAVGPTAAIPEAEVLVPEKRPPRAGTNADDAKSANDLKPFGRWRMLIEVIEAKQLPPAASNPNILSRGPGMKADIDDPSVFGAFDPEARSTLVAVHLESKSPSGAYKTLTKRKQTGASQPTLNPKFEHAFTFPLPLTFGDPASPMPWDWENVCLHAEVTDTDRFARDTDLGFARISFKDVREQEKSEWLPLANKSTSERVRGQLLVRYRFVAPDAKLYEEELKKQTQGHFPKDTPVLTAATASLAPETRRRVSRQEPAERTAAAGKSFLKKKTYTPKPQHLDWSKVKAKTVSRLDDHLIRQPPQGHGRSVVKVTRMSEYLETADDHLEYAPAEDRYLSHSRAALHEPVGPGRDPASKHQVRKYAELQDINQILAAASASVGSHIPTARPASHSRARVSTSIYDDDHYQDTAPDILENVAPTAGRFHPFKLEDATDPYPSAIRSAPPLSYAAVAKSEPAAPEERWTIQVPVRERAAVATAQRLDALATQADPMPEERWTKHLPAPDRSALNNAAPAMGSLTQAALLAAHQDKAFEEAASRFAARLQAKLHALEKSAPSS